MACAWGIVRNIIVIAQADILDVKLGESIGLRICHRGRLALKCGAAMLPREPRPREIIFAAAEVQRVAKEASVRAQLVYCNIRVAALINGGEKVIEQRRIRHINAAIERQRAAAKLAEPRGQRSDLVLSEIQPAAGEELKIKLLVSVRGFLRLLHRCG